MKRLRWWLWLLLPGIAFAQPSGEGVRLFVQSDEIRRVVCESKDYVLTTADGTPRVFLMDGQDDACPGTLPAKCTFGTDKLVDSVQVGVCPGASGAVMRCLELVVGPACDLPKLANCRSGSVYQVHQLVNTSTPGAADKLACDFRVDVQDTRFVR